MQKITKLVPSLGTLIILVAGAVFYFYTHPHLYRIPPDKDTVDKINFFALGDQGSGELAQWKVARAMEQVAEKEGTLDFVALLGDNFYHGVPASTESPEWSSKFERVYSGTYLSGTPFYAALGNHDHGHPDGDIAPSDPTLLNTLSPDKVQIEYARQHRGSGRWRMPDHHYRVDFGKIQDRPLLRLVVIDTDPATQDLSKEANFIRSQFRDTSNPPLWKVVIGHHPVRTYGDHKSEVVDAMLTSILPALQEAHVDLYLSSHDHSQQIIARNGEPFYAISGGGGARLTAVAEAQGDLLYSRSGHGFINAKLDKDSFSIGNYDRDGNKLAEYRIERTCTYGQAACLVALKN